MANLTKPEPPKWQTRQPEEYPVHRHNGIDYRIIPETAFRKLTESKDILWIGAGIAAVMIAAVTNVVMNAIAPPATATQQPIIIEKPVIVTQEKVVPTNCLAFCNR